MKIWISILSVCSLVLFASCGSFKAKRVDSTESDEKALTITDQWVQADTVKVIGGVLKQMQEHKGFKKYLSDLKRSPRLFVGEVQNTTSDAYFPIADLNDELLNEFSYTGRFTLLDAAQREKLLKEIKYQNDGMVDPKQAKSIGKQYGADLLVFGSVRMQPESRDGKTIKQYSVNMRMTNLETSEEVLRVRTKTQKYSEQSKTGW